MAFAGSQDMGEFYVTRESQKDKKAKDRKLSYVGMRDITQIDKIEEEDIVEANGELRGIKNRVRAGLANFEDVGALKRRTVEEGKIVVYTTTFRGVRSTFEDCKYVLSLFHNLRVLVDERDVYMDSFYYRELEERLGERLSVPQVFLSGQHIGDKKVIEELNEVGELRKMLADFPKLETANNCSACAGYGFIPCVKCGGSKNSVANNFTSEFRALKCTACNANGLQKCQLCSPSD